MNYLKELIYLLLGSSLYLYFFYAPLPEVTEFVYAPRNIILFITCILAMVLNSWSFEFWMKKKSISRQTAFRGIGLFIVAIPYTLFWNYLLKTELESEFVFDLTIKTGILLTTYSVAILIMEYVTLAYQDFSEQKVKVIKGKRKAAELRLEALKNQLSPHYLFNSLNTVAYLVIDNAAQADKYIRSIAQTYQYVMRYAHEQLISLHDELEVVHAFAFQLHTRHGQGIKINIDPQLMNHKGFVPPLSIQMLVENAVKHNVLSDDHPVEISITLDKKDDSLIIQNNITRSPNKRGASTKVGIENIHERYALMSNKKIEIKKTADYFNVRLPLLTA
ncbi:histidine kinase [Flammeovirga sp. SubArs3]|uniref:sensor histidine kinase n=1 Tax=Flammeovirga sp. SubArs3 TaxID=2995316 RepID=UPI00248B0342|nr:histidine kinase [Flammeovirga sp. SubArs3]